MNGWMDAAPPALLFPPLNPEAAGNRTRSGGAGENPGAAERLILLPRDSAALFAPYTYRSRVLYSVWCQLRYPCIPPLNTLNRAGAPALLRFKLSLWKHTSIISWL